MPLKILRPMTPGTRNAVRASFEEITTNRPEKSLVSRKQNHAGRNNRGRITAQGRGGGSRQGYRLIDFKRIKDGVPARVKSIEYDPNRTTRIALIAYADGEKSYILAPVGLAVGDRIESGPDAEISRGNALPLQNIPTGTVVHNLELTPGRGGPAGTGRWHRRSGALQGRGVCTDPVAFRGNAAGTAPVPGEYRSAIESRPQKRKFGKGRGFPAHGTAPSRKGSGQEPG